MAAQRMRDTEGIKSQPHRRSVALDDASVLAYDYAAFDVQCSAEAFAEPLAWMLNE